MTNQNNIFYLPELGENIAGGDLISVFVKVGEEITQDTSVCEIETDKATIDIPSSISGKVDAVFVKIGETAKVGQKIFSVVSSNEAMEKTPEKEKVDETKKKSVSQPETKPTTKIASERLLTVPDLGGSKGEEAEVIAIPVKKGDRINEGDTIAEAETDKATIDIPAEVPGTVLEVKIKVGDKIKKGYGVIKIIAQDDFTTEVLTPQAENSPTEKIVESVSKKHPQKTTGKFTDLIDPKRMVPASPHTRRFAREIGVAVEEVEGSGLRGRISVEDIKKHSKCLLGNIAAEGLNMIPRVPLPDFSSWGEVEVLQVNKIKQVTATHMSYCWNTIPHVTQFDEADIDYLEKQRKNHKETAKKAGISLTITAVLLKAVALVMKEFLQFNSSFDAERKKLILKKYIHIGVAVDTPNGLMVPVIRNVDQKGIMQLAKDLGEISQKARDRKVTPQDLQGGCFTISNLGGIAGTNFTPIVNWPEVAILGVSRSSIKPVYVDGTFQPRLIMPLSLSYDHRVINGAEGARFLARLIQYLEDPFLMNLGG